jgi:hypothetical protein
MIPLNNLYQGLLCGKKRRIREPRIPIEQMQNKWAMSAKNSRDINETTGFRKQRAPAVDIRCC